MKILNCPICKSTPVFITIDLDRGNGHGYPGYYSYHYECTHCKMVKSDSVDTVYFKGNINEINDKCIISWNKKVNEIRLLMGKKPLEVLEGKE